MPIYTSPERVERDGHLVAFAGEAMSEREAKRRGLIDDIEPETEPPEVPKAEKPARSKSGK